MISFFFRILCTNVIANGQIGRLAGGRASERAGVGRLVV